jgi:hypothetical protein
MALVANRLTARTVATIKPPGLHTDGGGLYLRIGKGGGRAWVFIYRKGSKRTELGLGSVRDVSLAEARERAAACRRRVAAGEDPRQERKTKAVPTFGELADEYIATHSRTWSNPKHIAQWKMTLTEYAAPIRRMPVDEITVDDVLAGIVTLNHIERNSPIIANVEAWDFNDLACWPIA